MATPTHPKVDINRATPEELAIIQGIGEERARLIYEFREEHGPFHSWNEVEEVPGIDPRTAELVKSAAVLGEAEDAGESEPDELDLALREEVSTLVALAMMDVEAAAGYATAAALIAEDDIRETIERFRADHLRHVEDLNRLIDVRGGHTVSLAPPDRSLMVMLAESMGALGTAEAIRALIGAEQLTNSVYESAMELGFDEDALDVVERNLTDEERHLEWLLAEVERADIES